MQNNVLTGSTPQCLKTLHRASGSSWNTSMLIVFNCLAYDGLCLFFMTAPTSENNLPVPEVATGFIVS